ncbi:hypothetical protein ACHAXS_010534 [Conticribra weissflogii]
MMVVMTIMTSKLFHFHPSLVIFILPILIILISFFASLIFSGLSSQDHFDPLAALRQSTDAKHLMHHIIRNRHHPPAVILIDDDVHRIPIHQLPKQHPIRPPRIPRLHVNILPLRVVELLLRIQHHRTVQRTRQNDIVPRQNPQPVLHVLLPQSIQNGLRNGRQRPPIDRMSEHPVVRSLLPPLLLLPLLRPHPPLLLQLGHPLGPGSNVPGGQRLPRLLVVLHRQIGLEDLVLRLLVVLLVVEVLVLLGEELVLRPGVGISEDVSADVRLVGVLDEDLPSVRVRRDGLPELFGLGDGHDALGHVPRDVVDARAHDGHGVADDGFGFEAPRGGQRVVAPVRVAAPPGLVGDGVGVGVVVGFGEGVEGDAGEVGGGLGGRGARGVGYGGGGERRGGGLFWGGEERGQR